MITRSKLKDQAVEALLALIEDRGLKPGDALPTERELSEILGVSRTVVREAFGMLEVRGLVEIRAGRGAVLTREFERAFTDTLRLVMRDDAHALEELFEVRRIFEAEVAALAAERAHDEHLRRMRAALELMASQLERPAGYVDADLAFHDALMEAAGNSVLMTMTRPVAALLAESRHLTAWRRRSPREALAEHERIAARVEAGDAEGARAEMRRHLDATAKDMQAGLAQAAGRVRPRRS